LNIQALCLRFTTAYGKPAEGSAIVPRNQYVEIRQEKPKNKYQQDAPEYKTCKFVTEAIVADGTDKGEFRKVCANPDCPMHHPKKQQRQANTDAAMKAAQEKQRREEVQAQATGLRVLKAVGDAVPVRLMKRDLLFVLLRLSAMLDERKLAVLIRQHGMDKPKDNETAAKLLAAFLPKAEESKLGRILVGSIILLSMHNQADAAKILRDAAHVYNVNVDAISATVKQEFAAKERGKASRKAVPRSESKPAKKAAA
jgi:ParB family chromosome partitioning protein